MVTHENHSDDHQNYGTLEEDLRVSRLLMILVARIAAMLLVLLSREIGAI